MKEFDFEPIIANIQPAIEYKIRRLQGILERRRRALQGPRMEGRGRLRDKYIKTVDYEGITRNFSYFGFTKDIGYPGLLGKNEVENRIKKFKEGDISSKFNCLVKIKYKNVEVCEV